MSSEERIAELEALVARQTEQIERLLVRNRELEAQLAQAQRDSHTSSKPPSSDGLRRKTRSLRTPSGKKAGGQLGHRGETLHLVATPDAVVEHRPAVCTHCQTPLSKAPEAAVVGRERRPVRELPPVCLVVTEHQALQVRCPACQQVSVGAFPTEVPSRTPQLLADLFGAQLGRGTLVSWVQQAARVLAPVEQQLKAALERAPVRHCDETGVRRAGTLAWAHVTSTARLTHYAIQAKRGQEATKAIGILPAYTGVSVHDGWASYRAYPGCRHALCNIHHLRELTFREEAYQQSWATALKALLREMKAAADQARAAGLGRLPTAQHAALVARYEALLANGLAANPPPARRAGQRGRLKQSPARNLLERLTLGQGQVLAFLDDLAIPFDNNQAERDLRTLKVQQKVSGCFRSDPGGDAFARLRSYLSTRRKQGHALFAALQSVFAGPLLYPAWA